MSPTAKRVAAVMLGTLLPLTAIAGVGTTTTTSLVTTTTTSTTLPPACTDDATVDSVGCRLDDLAARVAATDDLGRFGTRLAKNLARAAGLLDRADGTCRDDKRRNAKRQLKRLVRVMVRAGRAISSLRARQSIDPELRQDLRTDLRGVVRDIKRLRRHLTCPPASPSGAFV